ncbi:MAG: flavodoxin domain-containing protein [Marinibacterium sp.]
MLGHALRYLVVYATTEGQTRRICRFCADHLASHGHSVEMLRAEDAGDIDLPLFDAVILAGSVHLGRIQPALADFAATHAMALNTCPTLFLVVSLAIAANDPADCGELDRIAQDFADAAGWSPSRVDHVAGAFRFAEYDFFRSLAMRWIARQKGQDIDTSSDMEYTDWAALAALMDRWPEACDVV